MALFDKNFDMERAKAILAEQIKKIKLVFPEELPSWEAHNFAEMGRIIAKHAEDPANQAAFEEWYLEKYGVPAPDSAKPWANKTVKTEV